MLSSELCRVVQEMVEEQKLFCSNYSAYSMLRIPIMLTTFLRSWLANLDNLAVDNFVSYGPTSIGGRIDGSNMRIKSGDRYVQMK